MHQYNTIHKDQFTFPRPVGEGARQLLKHSLPLFLNSLSDNLFKALYAKSDLSIVHVFKQEILNSYSDQLRCPREAGCWPCSSATHDL